jgi:predicted PhzF superfamily epimerase YddE/YHI9
MSIPISTVDAFTDEAFRGNPAGVCIIQEDRDSQWMQRVAAEMNLSETAFVRRRASGDGFDLRWFTPTMEVSLCGHGTLATSHTLWESGVLDQDEDAVFHTLSGVLRAHRDGDWIELDFPRIDPTTYNLPPGCADALGGAPVWTGRDPTKLLVELHDSDTVRNMQPDFAYIRGMKDAYGVVVTARSDNPAYDFVSRFFAGGAGIDEDPVCGSAHCMLGPYWAQKLGKTEMMAWQCSARGGAVRVRVLKNRVMLGGQAVTTLRGQLTEAAIGDTAILA